MTGGQTGWPADGVPGRGGVGAVDGVDGARRTAIAAVGDGTASPGRGSPDAALARCASWITELSGLPAYTVSLPATGPGYWLGVLPPEVGAVFVSDTAPERARRLRIAASHPVLIDYEVTSVTLTAGVLTALARDGRPVSTSRVLLAGDSTPPGLASLLMAAGIRNVTIWHDGEDVIVPLVDLVDESDVVVDLAGTRAARTWHRPERALVSTSRAGRVSRVVGAGLLAALARTPGASVDMTVLEACVVAVVMATPPPRGAPAGGDGQLAARVADVATRALRAALRAE
jgi:malate dehydrogenase (oxaloacetate-decarboxylating)